MTKTARHSVDPGPTFNCRLPIFPDAASNLEFGLELEFFKSKGATPTQGPVLQTKQTIAYRLDVGDSSLALFTYGDAGHPLAVARIHGGKNEIMWYSGYGQVDFDPRLFTLPQGIRSEDMKR